MRNVCGKPILLCCCLSFSAKNGVIPVHFGSETHSFRPIKDLFEQCQGCLDKTLQFLSKFASKSINFKSIMITNSRYSSKKGPLLGCIICVYQITEDLNQRTLGGADS